MTLSESSNHTVAKKSSEENWLLRVSGGYADAYGLRALVQAIPGVGGAIDALLSGPGSNWRQKRVEAFLQDLAEQVTREQHRIKPERLQSEEMFDFFTTTLERVARVRSDEKRSRFARITARQIAQPDAWEDAENATRLIDRLSDLHIAVLKATADAPVCPKPFEGLRVVHLRNEGEKVIEGPINLRSHFPQIPERMLILACAELISAGLLEDEGVGRMGTGSLEFFVVSKTGEWFLSWL